jgi:succinoglycan biosynthesis transport protein ExoP
VIGIISMFPSEGKSTVSKNFASLIAHLGARTLLIDGDLRNPGLTRAIARRASAGAVEAIKGEKTLAELCYCEPRSGLQFLPTPANKRVNHTSDLLASAGMKNLLGEAGKAYDYVIVDLPPLGPVVDVKAAAALFDAFVLVIEWGRTSRRALQTMIESDPRLAANCVGAIFNKVKLAEINSYEGYGSKDYHYNSYFKYYARDGEVAEPIDA